MEICCPRCGKKYPSIFNGFHSCGEDDDGRDEKWIRLVGFIILTLVLGIFIYIFFRGTPYWAGTIVAFLIGIASLFKEEVKGIFVPPILIYKIKEPSEADFFSSPHMGRQYSNTYNLTIFNDGFSSAKNLKVKIKKSGEGNWGWLNLLRPYNSGIYLDNLHSKEEDSFNLGHLATNQYTFDLAVHTVLSPNNQEMSINTQEHEGEYNLEVVAENVRPQKFRLFVRKSTDGNKFNLSNIEFKKK